MRIFINPGHSIDPREDNGAIGNGMIEAEVALKIGERVAKYLRAINYTVNVFQYNWLDGIVNEANAWDADLFVSIHCNASPDGDARGTETYYYEYSDKSKRLARLIQNRILDAIPTLDRGIKDKIGGDFDVYVTKYTKMPAVLVETAFIDNYVDARILVDFEDEFARAIACAITDYFHEDYPIPDVIDD